MKGKSLLVLIAGALWCAWIVLWSGCAGKSDIPPASVIQRGKVSISWDEVPGAVAYTVYYGGSEGLTKWNSVKIPKASKPLTLTDLAWGKSYFFGLSAVTAAGEGEILVEREYTVNKADGSVHLIVPETPKPQAKPPQKPAPQSSLNAGDGKATLGWDSVPGATAYNLYISESPGVNRQNGRKIPNVANPHTLTGLTAGALYYVVITTVTPAGENTESSELSFTAE